MARALGVVVLLAACGADPAPGGGADDADGSPAAADAARAPDGSTAPSDPLGTATAGAPYACGDASCTDLTIACDQIADPIGVTLHVAEPPGAAIGTITLHAGLGGGGSWRGDDPDAIGAYDALRAAGYRMVEVRWATPWLAGDPTAREGFRRLGCRVATALAWVDDHLAGDGPLCATGQSAGAVQVALPLAYYGLGARLRAVVPSAGPGIARLDAGCLDADSAYDLEGVASLIDAAWGYPEGAGPCATRDEAARPTFEAESLALVDDGTFAYPTTRIVTIGGALDTVFSAHATAWDARLADAGDPAPTLEILPDVRHGVPNAPEGAAAIRDALLDACVAD
jgi:hypothetical protein